MPSYTEPTYWIADIYKSVELQAFDTFGETVILVRFVFPPGFKHAHLLPEREVPCKPMTLTEVTDKIYALGDEPVHLIADDAWMCGAEPLVNLLLLHDRPVRLLCNGFYDIPHQYRIPLLKLYVGTKPGLTPRVDLLRFASEIRTYWKPGDLEFEEHFNALDEFLSTSQMSLNKCFLVPYVTTDECIKATLSKSMESGWRFGLQIASALPHVDHHLTTNPEAEKAFHQRFYEAKKEASSTIPRRLRKA